MARLVITKTPEQLEQEDAERLRQREAEVQKRNLEHEKQLRILLKRERRNKVIVLGSFILLACALLVFGTYNTFFKQPLTTTDVQNVVNSSVVIFPETGLEGFIRKNFVGWYEQNVSYDTSKETGFEYVKPSLNTLTIDKVQVIHNQLVRVYFSVDIVSKKVDTKDGDNVITNKAVTTRSRFYIPVELHPNLNEKGQTVSTGYAAVGELTYYMLDDTDTADILTHAVFDFDTDTKCDDDTTMSARIKLDKILRDLYSGQDVSQEYNVPRPFMNENEFEYIGIDTFAMYTKANALGYNGFVTYTVQSKEGYKYMNSAYVAMSTNGTTWLLNGMTS